jgi:Methyltransferase domain
MDAAAEVHAPAPSLVRAARAFRYVDSLPKVGGWLNETTALAIIEALWLQERGGIAGNLAEIGVFQGKSFLALAAGASPGDRLLAVDIFDATAPAAAAERPDYDVLAYGRGNEARFRANLAEHFPEAEVTVIARSSADLRGREREFGLENLRFLSIDGGHTRQLTLNDLRIADACLCDAGLCCLDDVFNVHWLGVVSGLFEFLQSDPGLVPVALFPNKLFLGRPARKAFYADAFRHLFPEALERERLELHRAEVDVFGDVWPTVGGALRAVAGRVAQAALAEAAADASRAEARAANAEAVASGAVARAEHAERKLARRRAKRDWFRWHR